MAAAFIPTPARPAGATQPTTAVSLTARLDRLAVSRFHWKVLILSGLGWMFDAMDVLVAAAVAAAAARDWAGTAPETAGARAGIVTLVTSPSTSGLFLGALLSGLLADRVLR
jgi:putative MFS transporter